MESNSETMTEGNVALVEDASSSLVNVTEDDVQMTINSEGFMNKNHEMEAEKEDIMKYNKKVKITASIYKFRALVTKHLMTATVQDIHNLCEGRLFRKSVKGQSCIEQAPIHR